MLENIALGFSIALQPGNLLIAFCGVLLGIAFGAMPGLSGTMGIAILLPITYSMSPAGALIIMISLYCGSLYGGSISACLLHTPGTPAAAATILDGYPMTMNGYAFEALTESAVSSFWGGIISVVALLTIAPQIAKFSLKFGPLENFWIAIFGLTIIASMASKNMLKGLISGLVGMLLGSVGMDSIVGYRRYTFGSTYLVSGITLIVALIGLFSIAQVLRMVANTNFNMIDTSIIRDTKNKKLKLKDFFRYPVTYLRGGIIGTIIGIVPGAGGSIAGFLSYNETKKASKDPDSFGKGAREGVAASESANNAVSGGALIPMLTLGIPGSAAIAVMQGGMMIHGLIPGSDLFTKQASTVYPVMCSMIFANLFFLIIGVTCAKYFAGIANTPTYILAPIIAVFCVVGAFAINNSIKDVYITLLFGAIGFAITLFDFEVTPIILGLILGELAEGGLVRSLMIYKGIGGTIEHFFASPISLVLFVISVLSVATPLYKERREKKRLQEKK